MEFFATTPFVKVGREPWWLFSMFWMEKAHSYPHGEVNGYYTRIYDTMSTPIGFMIAFFDIRLKKIPEAQVTVPPELAALFGKNTNKMCGVSPSDIDKYSRLLFPVFFVSFNMMYWIIYLHISDTLGDSENLVLKDNP